MAPGGVKLARYSCYDYILKNRSLSVEALSFRLYIMLISITLDVNSSRLTIAITAKVYVNSTVITLKIQIYGFFLFVIIIKATLKF